MIKFDPAQYSFEIVQLKSLTTALGGSITIVTSVDADGKETTKRVDVPLAVCRAFIQQYQKVSKYIKPVYTAIVRYGDHVIALERHPLGTLGALQEVDEVSGVTRTWVPASDTNFRSIIKPLVERGDRNWYFDGRYVYALPCDDVNLAVQGGQMMTLDGHFRKVEASTFDLQRISVASFLVENKRSCLAFVATTGDCVVSPPIWNDLNNVGGGSDDEDASAAKVNTSSGAYAYNFDRIDAQLAVNLNFALKAGAEIGRTFGYEYVEPLMLAEKMIDLHTTNLPNVPLSIKSTYDIGMSFTHSLAWLLGLLSKTNTLEAHMAIRSLLKYLTTKGVYSRNTVKRDYVYKNPDAMDVPVRCLTDLLNNEAAEVSLGALFAAVGGSSTKKKATMERFQIDGLMTEE